MFGHLATTVTLCFSLSVCVWTPCNNCHIMFFTVSMCLDTLQQLPHYVSLSVCVWTPCNNITVTLCFSLSVCVWTPCNNCHIMFHCQYVFGHLATTATLCFTVSMCLDTLQQLPHYVSLSVCVWTPCNNCHIMFHCQYVFGHLATTYQSHYHHICHNTFHCQHMCGHLATTYQSHYQHICQDTFQCICLNSLSFRTVTLLFTVSICVDTLQQHKCHISFCCQYMFGHLALGNCHIIFHWHCVSVFVGTLQQNVCHITNLTVALLLTISIWTLQQHTCHIINASVTLFFTGSTCFLHCFVWLKQSVYI